MIEKIKNRILPLLFGSSVAYMIISCYHNTDAFVISAVFFVYAFLCFAVFDLIRKTKFLCGFLYALIFSAVLAVSVSAIVNVENASLEFSKWFYAPQTEATRVPEYSFALVFGGGFFIISILYYFTQVIYRAFGTMLIMFFPLFIYAKRLDEIDTMHFVILLGLYVALLVHNRQMKSEKDSLVILNRSYVGSVGAFSVIVMLLTSLIPKPDVVSRQEEDGSVVNITNSFTSPTLFSNRSSLTGGELSDEILFYVETDRSMFLRRQAYDDYDGEAWILNEADEAADLIPEEPNTYAFNTLYTTFIETFSDAYKNHTETIGFDFPEASFELPDAQHVTITTTDIFKPVYLPVALNTVSIEGSEYKRTYHGEYKPSSDSNYERLNYFSFEYVPFPEDVDEFLTKLNLSFDEVFEIIEVCAEQSEYSGSEYQKYSDMYMDTYYTNENFDSQNFSDKLKSLALDITSGFSNPYDKAKALEGYFEEENFKYDPKYTAFDSGIDYFLFESKSGACGDFATAMTLMARAVGLKARYVEGFVVNEKFDENTYVVREYHSHAYVEVYIPGFGWMVFDPTVSDYVDYYDNPEDDSFAEWFENHYKQIVAALIVAALIWLLRKQIYEMFFRIRICFTDSEETIILCYNRLVKILSRRLNKNLSGKSPTEISNLLESCGLTAQDYIRKFEKVCYGCNKLSADEKEYCIVEYKRLKCSIMKLKT